MTSQDPVVRQFRLRLQGIQRALGQNHHSNLDQLDHYVSILRRHFLQLGVVDSLLLRDIEDTSHRIQALRAQARIPSTSPTNRRHNQINQSRLKNLLDLGFTIRRIASEGLLGFKVHHNTIHRFIRRRNMVSRRESFSQLSDDELRQKISNIHQRFPNCIVLCIEII